MSRVQHEVWLNEKSSIKFHLDEHCPAQVVTCTSNPQPVKHECLWGTSLPSSSQRFLGEPFIYRPSLWSSDAATVIKGKFHSFHWKGERRRKLNPRIIFSPPLKSVFLCLLRPDRVLVVSYCIRRQRVRISRRPCRVLRLLASFFRSSVLQSMKKKFRRVKTFSSLSEAISSRLVSQAVVAQTAPCHLKNEITTKAKWFDEKWQCRALKLLADNPK